MHPLLPSLLAAFLYAGATTYQGLRLRQRAAPDKRLLVSLGALALLAHALSLYIQLITPVGLTLDFFNAASLIAAAVILPHIAGHLADTGGEPAPAAPATGAADGATGRLRPSGTVQAIDEEPGILAHILLSILAYGMLTIAVFQSLLLLLQDHQLTSIPPG